MAEWSTHLEMVSAIPPNAGTWLFNQTGVALPQDHVYVRSNFAVPPIDHEPWFLDVSMTERHRLPLESLRVFPPATITMVLECAGNGRTLMAPTPEGTPWTLGGASMTTFGGVWLRDVLASLTVPTDTAEIVFTGADWGTVPEDGEVPYQFSLPVDEALDGGAMLAWTMGGEPLSQVHGAPVRLVVPGQYAMKSVKWLRRIEAVPKPFVGHFVRKYRYVDEFPDGEDSPVGSIRVRSVIANPADGARVRAGRLSVVGSAWSSGGGISRVDVSCDGGSTWVQAQLRHQDSTYAAVPWSVDIEVVRGPATIVARATDATGDSQPLAPRWNRNGYGNNVAHRVGIEVV